MSAGSEDLNKNAATVLSKLPDLRDEQTALKHTLGNWGHILLLSPKHHANIAGFGIEFS